MPRKINQSISRGEPLVGALAEEKPVAPAAAEKPAPAVEPEPKVPEFDYESCIKGIIETNPAVSLNKKLKESLKEEMQKGKKSFIETKFGVAKISESEAPSIDEEGLMGDLKAKGFGKYVKTRTIEYVDMDELESDIYNKADGSDDLESAVKSHTSIVITKKLLVSAPKKKKGE